MHERQQCKLQLDYWTDVVESINTHFDAEIFICAAGLLVLDISALRTVNQSIHFNAVRNLRKQHTEWHLFETVLGIFELL